MGKYSPLGDFLRRQTTTLVPMTFAEIERIIGAKLPRSRRYPAWWSNNPWNNVMTQVWLDAGFETEQVDVEKGTLIFRRVRDQATAGTRGAPSARHPLIGWLKGTVQIAPGVDLTEPADPEWGPHVHDDRPYRDRK